MLESRRNRVGIRLGVGGNRTEREIADWSSRAGGEDRRIGWKQRQSGEMQS
jgi:hypothetical protein